MVMNWAFYWSVLFCTIKIKLSDFNAAFLIKAN